MIWQLKQSEASSLHWNLHLEPRYHCRNSFKISVVCLHMSSLQSKVYPILLLLKYTVILSVVSIEMLKSMTVTFISSLNVISFQDLLILLFQYLVFTHYLRVALTMARLRHLK